MNGYERIQAALRGVMPDRRPVMLHNFRVAAREAGYTMKQYREDPEVAARSHIQFVEKYGVDGIFFDVDTALLACTVGVPVDYPEDEPARTHGILLHALQDVDSLGEIDISHNRRIEHAVETIKILKRYFKNEIYLRGNCDQAPFSLACSMRSPGNFMIDLLTDEEQALKLISYASHICLQLIRLLAEAGADMVSNGDSPAGPTMISPDMYRRFAYPYEKLMLEEAHACKLPYLLHICGNTAIILDQIAQMGLDAVELDYETSTDKIYHHFHDRTALFGTVDPSGVMALGTPEMVSEEAAGIVDAYKGNPRLVLGTGCAIPPMAPEENIRAIIRCARHAELF
ncbi:uroporphyrinogen decarboxylase family protein [Parabacteroides sp. OttesenSCG-928-K15]|nr:uroporphyrinogen decarboxylase family protein [Parabacteroides sp. OttesenSCG-928-K15]